MFPPRAESVDSFSHQPAIGQPESQNIASESGKPAKGLSRRHALAGLAVLPAVPFATARIGSAVTSAIDPAFDLIARKRAADLVYGLAIDAQDEAAKRYGINSEEDWAASDLCEVHCDVVNRIDWDLARTPPTTLAGVAAVLRFANQIEDQGLEWPMTDTVGREGWHYRLRATMAQAIETIVSQKAVQS